MNDNPSLTDEKDLEQPGDTSFSCDTLGDFSDQRLVCLKENVDGCLKCGIEYNLSTPIDDRKIIEVSCQGLINYFFCIIPDNFIEQVHLNERVIVDGEDCCDMCTVSTIGELVKIKRQKLGLCGEILPVVVRKITNEDLEILNKNRIDELKAKELFKTKAQKYNLNMKLVDIHFQFDRKKLFFFFTSNNRVDFRDLVKDLATEFKTRIELRQIGVRDEAKRLGGLAVCGREFCCTCFIGNFKHITCQNATEQNLSSNLSKLSGPCGKLKCCLSFEI